MGTLQSHKVKEILFSQTCVQLLHFQLNLANIKICIHCYAISISFLLVHCLFHPPFRESDEHSISGVFYVVHGSARLSCVCSSSYSLSVPIGLKLVIAYKSYRCASGLYTILSHIDFSHFFSRDHV